MFNKERVKRLEEDVDLLFDHIGALHEHLGIETKWKSQMTTERSFILKKRPKKKSPARISGKSK